MGHLLFAYYIIERFLHTRQKKVSGRIERDGKEDG
jgi:hypothetical protein